MLHALKAAGPQTAEALGRKLGMTAVGARQHLLRLQEEGLVDAADQSQGVGRPKRFWSLTDAGNARFPDNHAGLTLELITAIRKTGGETMLDAVIEAREKAALQAYRRALDCASSLKDKVKRLAKIRSTEGYMASVAAGGDGALLLVENHCPICVAAKACQGFCRSELALFRETLGKDVSVARDEHIVSGARRCVYRITAK
ncbi:helix-turn-helix transcriptional regulator [Dongia sedimenti]|uniref:Transcriptional regulator n=1 Tax=Dongia sedimenti TaxID=3064282 RepID=A0ABU0YGF5_9PROT|nr:transcriptional regulator [Rhodospirillaceae bacterium R-7]